MLQNKIKLVAVLSVVLNLCLGFIVARHLGQISAFEVVNRIYLAAACANIDTFRETLENFDVNGLFETKGIGAKINSEQKREWVEKHLASCPGKSAQSCVVKEGENGKKPYLLCPKQFIY